MNMRVDISKYMYLFINITGWWPRRKETQLHQLEAGLFAWFAHRNWTKSLYMFWSSIHQAPCQATTHTIFLDDSLQWTLWMQAANTSPGRLVFPRENNSDWFLGLDFSLDKFTGFSWNCGVFFVILVVNNGDAWSDELMTQLFILIIGARNNVMFFSSPVLAQISQFVLVQTLLVNLM